MNRQPLKTAVLDLGLRARGLTAKLNVSMRKWINASIKKQKCPMCGAHKGVGCGPEYICAGRIIPRDDYLKMNGL